MEPDLLGVAVREQGRDLVGEEAQEKEPVVAEEEWGEQAPEQVPGGCVCPSCGAKVSHQTGTPCYNISCPQCGISMVRG